LLKTPAATFTKQGKAITIFLFKGSKNALP